MPTTLDALIDLAVRHSRGDGTHETHVRGLALIRYSRPTATEFALHMPALCVVLQGGKELTVGDRAFGYGAGQHLVVSLDLPVSGRIVKASARQPYLCLRVELERNAIASLVVDHPDIGADAAAATRAAYLGDTTPGILDVAWRLARLLDGPPNDGVLRELALRELAYWLLVGQHGATLRQLAVPNSGMQRIERVIGWLKTHYRRPLRIKALGALAGMSPSTLHERFKAVTGMTPLQYQKQLRLQQARQLMLAHGRGAAAAGFEVGYESATQFSREYRRLFGQPPARDVSAARALARADGGVAHRAPQPADARSA